MPLRRPSSARPSGEYRLADCRVPANCPMPPAVRYNPGHKWYQTPGVVTQLIKDFDSDVNKARFAPHSAFADKTSPAAAPLRQLIKVRAMVFDAEQWVRFWFVVALLYRRSIATVFQVDRGDSVVAFGKKKLNDGVYSITNYGGRVGFLGYY